MARFQSQLVAIAGCIMSLVSFFFFPLLVVPFSPVTFTGLQLMKFGVLIGSVIGLAEH